jgi:tRNA dimethylallyltransferase
MTIGTVIPVLVVFGPTASGKTALAGAFFSEDASSFLPDGSVNRFRGRVEIISADSMQVYRGMDIGTAKPDPVFIEKLPHHLINLRSPREQFSAGDFVRLADEACADIASRGKFPVILGGTAFYIRNFLFGLPVTPESNDLTRQALIGRMKVEGADVLMAELRSVDPESAARIHINDEYRIIRALEVYAASGRPLSSFGLPSSYRAGYRFLVIALDRPRDELNERIDRRVDGMFDMGLEREVRALVEAGFSASDPGMQAIGYREFFMIDPFSRDIPAIRELVKSDSRKYARRQETFIRSMPDVVHLPAGDHDSFCRAVRDFFAQKGSA